MRLELFSAFVSSSFKQMMFWLYFVFHYLIGVSLSKPYVNSYNFTNNTCPFGSVLGQSFKGIGDICPVGHYCPKGSYQPTPCLAGTYNNKTGQSLCETCPAGYFCYETTVSYVSNICPSGYYCPSNTTHPHQYPCPPGTFNNHTGQKDATSCRPCTPGMFCENHGLSWPTGLCSPGWYCNGSSQANKTLIHGGRCQPGTYCPQGSAQPRLCDRGKYCAVSELDSPTDNCSAGYYCNLGSTTPNPLSSSAGDECPRGYYCPAGTPAAIPCDPGTFVDSKASKNKSFCKPCTAGKFCNGSGLPVPVGDCDPGFSCPPGQISSKAFVCPEGYYCTGGKGYAEPCPSGSYQDQKMQPTCKMCPKRFYCNATNGPVVNYTHYICPEGYYCPNGTQFAEEYPCDVGTFNNITGRASQSECTQCLGGYYCGKKGLTYPYTTCNAMYYCRYGKYYFSVTI